MGRSPQAPPSFLLVGVWVLPMKPHAVVKFGRWVCVGRYAVIASENGISIGDYTVIARRRYFVGDDSGFSLDGIILNQASQLQESTIDLDCCLRAGTV